MPRNYGINIHHECDITHLNHELKQIVHWCEQHLQHGWNIVSDSGSAACRGTGEHRVIFLCDQASDFTFFKLHWSDNH